MWVNWHRLLFAQKDRQDGRYSGIFEFGFLKKFAASDIRNSFCEIILS